MEEGPREHEVELNVIQESSVPPATEQPRTGAKEDEDKGKPLLLKKNHSATIKSILDCTQETLSANNRSANYMNLFQSVDSMKSRDPMIKTQGFQM